METISIEDVVYSSDYPSNSIDMPGHELECPECKKFHPAQEWQAVDVPCESCGEHSVLVCPQGHNFDPYLGERGFLNVRNTVDSSDA